MIRLGFNCDLSLLLTSKVECSSPSVPMTKQTTGLLTQCVIQLCTKKKGRKVPSFKKNYKSDDI